MSDLTTTLIGEDRIVSRDVSRKGLHRLHVVRHGAWPDDLYWVNQVPVAVLEKMTRHWWKDGNDHHLYLTWPEPEPVPEYWDKP